MKFYIISMSPDGPDIFPSMENLKKMSLICMPIIMSIHDYKIDIFLQKYVRIISIVESYSTGNFTLDQYLPTARTYLLERNNFKKLSSICMPIMMSINDYKRDIFLQE